MVNYSNFTRWVVIIGDFFIVAIVLGIMLLLSPMGDGMRGEDMKMYATAAVIGMILAQTRFGTIIHKRFVSFDQILRQVFWLSVVFGVCTYIATRLLSVGGHHLGWWTCVISAILFGCLIIVRTLELVALPILYQKSGKQKHILFVGDLPANQDFLRWFRTGFTYRYVIDGYFSNDNDPNLEKKVPRLGNLDDFRLLVRGEAQMDRHIDELFCILPNSQRRFIEQTALFCDRHVIHFFYMPAKADRWDRLSLRPVYFGDQEIYARYDMPLSDVGNRFVKRTFDIIFSAIVLIPIGLMTPLFAFLIKHQSPGPIFFKQDRTGMGGRTFKMWKFRSMHVNVDADRVQATKDDPRKFPFGEFMRRTNLDELPQFWNVLVGDMSIVGPRPHMLYHTEFYSERLQQYMARHFVRPGITGWAQVTGFRGETQTDEQMEGRIKGDIWYMEHWTFWLDLRIILKTIKSIFVHDESAY